MYHILPYSGKESNYLHNLQQKFPQTIFTSTVKLELFCTIVMSYLFFVNCFLCNLFTSKIILFITNILIC